MKGAVVTFEAPPNIRSTEPRRRVRRRRRVARMDQPPLAPPPPPPIDSLIMRTRALRTPAR
jgi:hypothetical protein